MARFWSGFLSEFFVNVSARCRPADLVLRFCYVFSAWVRIPAAAVFFANAVRAVLCCRVFGTSCKRVLKMRCRFPIRAVELRNALRVASTF